MKYLLASIIVVIGLSNCNTHSLENIPAMNDDGSFNAIVEIPAGTNHKIEFNKECAEFEVDFRDGKERIIQFLPYPGNYGFIPKTMMAEDRGGDGDALDVLIIAESMPTGTWVKFRPLAMLKLIDDGEKDFKILGVPSDPKLNVLNVNSYAELVEAHPQVLIIVENWFLSYDSDPAQSEGWANGHEAEAEIRRWLVP
mgnify:CR=1 FL=1|jgi:inorganic pyrophosphatase